MLRNPDGSPQCGSENCRLGVRIPIDIRPDAVGFVHAGTGGMSVTPDDLVRLPPHFRPIAYGGIGKLPVFAMLTSRLGDFLSCRRDPKGPERHAFVEPAGVMPLAAYQDHLAATAPNWQVIA